MGNKIKALLHNGISGSPAATEQSSTSEEQNEWFSSSTVYENRFS